MRTLNSLATFGFAAIGGASPFVVPWPAAVLIGGTLLLVCSTLQRIRDLDVEGEVRATAGSGR